MTTKRSEYATEQAYENDAPNAPFGFEITKVIREYKQPKAGGTATIGETLDMYLLEMAKAGTEVQSVKLHIREEQWFNIAEQLRNTNRNY